MVAFKNLKYFNQQDKHTNTSLIMAAIAIVFTAKALYLSFCVTPLWSIPDEIGHLAYVYDIAEERGIPLLGESKIDSDIMSSYKGTDGARPSNNWIAQHPPLYYILASIPLKIGRQITKDKETLFKLPRIVSAISGGLALFVIFSTIQLIGLDAYRSILIASAIGFIPMFTHLCSGVNHDSSLLFFSATAVYFLTKFIMNKNIHDAYWSGLWMTLTAAIKMTSWVIIPPFLAIIGFQILFSQKKWIKHTIKVSVLTLAIPILWMGRNFYYFADPLYTASTKAHWRLSEPLKDSFLTYLTSQPVVQHLLLNFYALIGWQTPGITGNTWFQIRGFPLKYFLLVLFFMVVALAIALFKTIKQLHTNNYNFKQADTQFMPLRNFLSNKKTRCLIINTSIAISTFFCVLLFSNSHFSIIPFSDLRILSICLLVWACCLSLVIMVWTTTMGPRQILMSFGLITFLFFTFTLLQPLYKAYLMDGRMRATHGRYFYPVTPFIILSFAIAVYNLRINRTFLFFGVIGLAIMEWYSYLLLIIPFFWSFK